MTIQYSIRTTDVERTGIMFSCARRLLGHYSVSFLLLSTFAYWETKDYSTLWEWHGQFCPDNACSDPRPLLILKIKNLSKNLIICPN